MASFKCHHHQSVTTMKVSIDAGHVKKNMLDTFENMMQGFRSSSPPRAEERMGTKFVRPPFGYPSSQKHHRTVNEILHVSLCHQREEDISNCPGFISYVVSLCLEAVNVNCRLDSGSRKVGSHASSHMWLIVCEIVIDNCYTKTLTKDDIVLLEKKLPKGYESATYSYSNSDLASVEKEKVSVVKTKKLIDLFKQDPQKAMVLCLNREDLSNYFFSMIRYMWENHKVNIAGVDPCIRYICWQCGKLPHLSDVFLNDIFLEKFNSENSTSDGASGGFNTTTTTTNSCASDVSSVDTTWKFPVCGQCKIASYCCTACQSTDWRKNHKFTCRMRSSVCLLPSDGPD